MKTRFLHTIPLCASLFFLPAGGARLLRAADAQSSPAPAASEAPARAAEILKTVQPALDDLSNKPDAEGAYAIDDGKLLRLASIAGGYLQSADEAKRSHLLSGKPCFILYKKWLPDHPPAAGSIFGYDWRVMDVRPTRKVAYVTQPVPDHPDMLLIMPAETLKPGLFSLQAYDSQEGEFKFGVDTPDDEAFWREVAKDQPDSWHAHSYLGAILWARHDVDGALLQWKRSTELKPMVYETHNNYALALAAKGRTDDALEQYKLAVAAWGSWQVRMNYANALLSAKHYDEAIKQYDAVQKLDPGNALALICQGACYSAEQEWEPAAACFQMALEIDPDNVNAKKNFEIARQKLAEAAIAEKKAWKGE